MKKYAWALLLMVAVLVISSCTKATESDQQSGPDPDDSACVGPEADDALAADTAAATQASLNLEPLSTANPLEGKKVSYIAAGLSFPFSQDVLAGVEEATKAAGADLDVSDSGGDVAKAASQIDQAVSGGADAILLQGVDPNAVSASMRNANANDVSVVAVASLDPGPVPANLATNGLSAIVGSVNDISDRQANFIAADSGCDAEVVYVGSSTFPSNDASIQQFQDRMSQICPECKVSVLDSPLSQWSNQLGPQVRAFLQKNPDTTYVVTVVDDMFTSITPAIQSIPGDVRLVGNNALVGTIQQLQESSGSKGVAATVGSALGWMGWAAVDQAQRIAAGDAAVDLEPIPNRTFTLSNAQELDVSDPNSWYGSVDYQGYYTDLWQVGQSQ